MSTPSAAPSIGAIQAVGVRVIDQDRALRFYTDTLGFDIDIGMDVPLPQLGGRWITVAPPGTSVAVALLAASDRLPVGVDTGIRFHTDDADATHAALRTRGVEVGELLRWPGVPARFTAHDPDGNRFEIME